MANRRAKGFRAIGAESGRTTVAIRRARGFLEAGLFSDWREIVGEILSSQCVPLRLVRGREGEGGTLHLRVAGALALELQHLEPQVIERINGFYGYRAVGGLRLHQHPVSAPERPKPAAAPSASRADLARLDENLARVNDEGLRRVLRNLGACVLARANRANGA